MPFHAPPPLVLEVKVRPGAKRDAWRGRVGTALKVDVAAPPERGQANERLLQFVAGSFAVPRSAIALLAGGGGRQKRLRISGNWKIPEILRPWLAGHDQGGAASEGKAVVEPKVRGA